MSKWIQTVNGSFVNVDHVSLITVLGSQVHASLLDHPEYVQLAGCKSGEEARECAERIIRETNQPGSFTIQAKITKE